MTMPRQVSVFLTSRRANAAIEFALTVPVMLVFMGGIVEFGRAFQAYDSVNRLATRYAIAWADCNDNAAGYCGSTELPMYTAQTAISNFVPQLNPANGLSLRMIEVSVPSSGPSTPTVVYASPSGATLSTTELSAVTAAISNVSPVSPGSPSYVVVVTVQYTYNVQFFASLLKFVPNVLNRQISYTVAQLHS